MILVSILAAAALGLSPNARALTPEQARALTPQSLADALLAPGHDPATEAVVGREGMYPPTPPGEPEITSIKLYLIGKPSTEPGFCEKQLVTVTLAPAAREMDGRVAPARPASLSTETMYRLRLEDNAHCEVSRNAYFVPDPGALEQRLNTVRLLAKAVWSAKHGARLPFELTVDDKHAREIARLRAAGADLGPVQPWEKPLTDARAALARLPIEQITWTATESSWSNPLSEADRVGPHGQALKTAVLFMGNEWLAGIALDHHRIVRLRLVRDIPPPF